MEINSKKKLKNELKNKKTEDEEELSEINKKLDEFKSLLNLITTPLEDISLKEKDIEILKEIQYKIINLTEGNNGEIQTPKIKNPKKLKNLKSHDENLLNPVSKPRSITFYNNKLRLSQYLDDTVNQKPIEEGIKEFEDLIASFEYFSRYLLEKADHVLKLRIATINSSISYRTAEFFFKNFSNIILESTHCAVLQRSVEDLNFSEVYGVSGNKEVRISFV